MDAPLFAVITGDVIGSSRVSADDRTGFLNHLKGLFQTVGDRWPDLLHTPFQIYRGDGFQAALSDPRLALRVALVIRCGLRSGYPRGSRPVPMDARIAIGVGSAEFPTTGSTAEADGEAFRRSGQLLDRMADFRLLVSTPAPEIDEEINVELGLIDTIIDRWTPAQAEAMMHFLLACSQREIAGIVNVSAAAVSQRLKAAGNRPVERAIQRFEYVMGTLVLKPRAATIETGG